MTLQGDRHGPDFDDFLWDQETEEKIYQKHNLLREEVEEAFRNADMETLRKKGGGYAIRGRTSQGWMVEVVFQEESQLISPITAYRVDEG